MRRSSSSNASVTRDSNANSPNFGQGFDVEDVTPPKYTDRSGLPLRPSAQRRGGAYGDPSSNNGASRRSVFAAKKQEMERELSKGPAIALDRPFTLPPGAFKPKQSLGQNFLSDQNYVIKICDAFTDTSEGGHRVVEVGPGPGALSRVLYPRYPKMSAIELDQRAIKFLSEKLPGLKVIHEDVLLVDCAAIAAERGGPVRIIANLPYYIVSQVLFSLADTPKAVECAVVTMQLEVAERVTARPRTKDYGIPSVVFQLYCKAHMNFKIPPSVFFPKPAVDSALVTLDFTRPHPDLQRVRLSKLRLVLTTAFQQRRKMLRKSLQDLLKAEELTMPEKWAEHRPDALTPIQFVQLTIDLFGEIPKAEREASRAHSLTLSAGDKELYEGEMVWRRNISPSAKINKIRKNKGGLYGEDGMLLDFHEDDDDSSSVDSDDDENEDAYMNK